MPKRTYFKQEWIDPKVNPEWVEIISPVAENPFVFLCKVCKKTVNLSNMGRQAINSHTSSSQHKKNMTMKNSNLKIDEFTNTVPNLNQTENIKVSTVTHHTQKGRYFNKSDVFQAEIRWVLHIIEAHSSYNSCSKAVPVLKKMFFDSDIAQSMSLGPTKASYLLVYGLASYFSDILRKTLKECNQVVVCFDESLNKVAQRGQMDLVIRFWDQEENIVVSKYLKSVFIEGRATAENILKHFLEGISSVISLNKILQVSMDGPNVNWKFYKCLQIEMNDHKMIDLGSCGLHVIHGALQHGHKAAGWNVNSFLTGIYWLFKDSPARRSDFISKFFIIFL